MHSIATHAHSTRARCQYGYKHLTPANSFGYHPSVSAKKALVGIGVPCNPYDESRRTPAVSAASLSVPPVLVARMGGRKAAGSCKGFPVRQPCSSYLLGLASGEVVFANRTSRRPFMAHIIPHPRARSERVIQTRKAGRLPKSIVSIGTVQRDRSFARYMEQRRQEEIAAALTAAAEWEGVGRSLRLKAEALKQQARSAKP